MTTTKVSLTQKIVPSLSAGLAIGVINVVVGISLAALIFKDEVPSYAANGIGLILLGGIPALLTTNFLSSYKGSITILQDAPAAILAVMAASILHGMQADSPLEKFMTILAMIASTSLLTGLFFILLGQFKLGSLVRFLPYPVVGGFLAGTGWLLVTGGIEVMSDLKFNITNLGALFQPEVIFRWTPGVILAFIMLLILNRYSHFLILPFLLIAPVILFYGFVFASDTPVSELNLQGWLLGPFPDSNLLPSLHLSDMALIHWDSILMQAGGMASIIMISVVSMLLNVSGIELALQQDVNINRELRVIGLGNILSGLIGGGVSYHALTDTVINHKVGKGNRLTAWVAIAIICSPLFFGAAKLSYFPKIAMGVPLILFGLSFLYEWIYQAWSKMSRLEYAIILLILVSIAVFGYLQGVGVGIVAAVGIFVFNYSRVNTTRHVLTGADRQSRVTRAPAQRTLLIEQGEKTLILELQGFIFFGTANRLLEQVRRRIELPTLTPLQYLLLDFSKVSGLDSTAMLSFSKMKQILSGRHITVLVSGASDQILKQLENGGFVTKDSETVKSFPDLDHGLEWAENRLLNLKAEQLEKELNLRVLFNEISPNEQLLNDLFQYLDRREVTAGDYLMRQEDQPDHIYFVESGQFTAQLEYAGQPAVRLETMKAGRVIGEVGFYLGQRRTASVIADEGGVVYQLTGKKLEQMENHAPEVALYLHRLIIKLLAERTTHLIRTVAALEK